jgi:hypothetical protein
MWACITLQEMGKREDKRTTRELDPAQLAALARSAVPEEDERGDKQEQAEAVNFGRAPTIDDPLTTGLLAEVARRSQTTEFDDELIHDVLDQLDSGETNHPHTRRRSR